MQCAAEQLLLVFWQRQPRHQNPRDRLRQLFDRIGQVFHFRAADHALRDLIQNIKVFTVQPEDQFGERGVGKFSCEVDVRARHKLAVPNLPEGKIMLNQPDVATVFHNRIIIIVREHHSKKRRGRYKMPVA